MGSGGATALFSSGSRWEQRGAPARRRFPSARTVEDVRGGSYKKQIPAACAAGIWGKAPGDDLLSQGLSHTTMGGATIHFRARDGIGWFHSANFTRETVGASPALFFRVGREQSA